MRKLIASEFLTLDGVYQGPGSPDEDRSGGFELGGWQIPYVDDVMLGTVSEGIASAGAYLLGRKTYEIFASYWPSQPDSDPFAKTLNGLPKHVVSKTLSEPLEWRNSMLISGDVAAEVAKLKEQPGGDISILGSGELVRTLAENDLIDQYWLMICPTVLGSGKRLFGDGFVPRSFELVESTVNSKGALMLRYRPGKASAATQ